MVTDVSKDALMVSSLLAFKTEMGTVVSQAFMADEMFVTALKESFKVFINKRQNKPPELIAKYIDKLLKSGKGMTEEEVENKLDQCLELFRFVQGKDVFEAFYGKDLAKRLLLQKSASVDAEKSMLSKLKKECGAGFTNKLEGMFKDMELSRDIMTSYRQSTKSEASFDMNVFVITFGFWPSYPLTEMILPVEFSRAQEAFTEYYVQKHSGRHLTWQNSLGHCAVKCNFPLVFPIDVG